MKEVIEKECFVIEDMIYEVRGTQVMFSKDVALLYQVETKRLNEVVKRNMNRFPESFCFQLTEKEFKMISSRSQIATLNKSNNLRGYNIKYLPYVLTEQGIMMLSGLLKSDIAVRVNIQIIDAFVKMRKYFAKSTLTNEMLINHENRILKLEDTFNRFNEKKEINKIFFEGELYDAYSLLLDIFGKLKSQIIIIDNYAGKELLDLLRTVDKEIIVVSKNIDGILKNKYESQYTNIIFINNDSFHDRFIILDRTKLYSCGASFKDMGKKCFAINEFNDKEYLTKLLNILNINQEVIFNILFKICKDYSLNY